MPGGYVAGRKFNIDSEYRDAISDAELVNRLKAETDMNDPKAVSRLYSSLQSGEIRFKTIIGRDFDDDLYELVERFKSEETADTKNRNKGVRKNKEPKPGILKNVRQKKQPSKHDDRLKGDTDGVMAGDGISDVGMTRRTNADSRMHTVSGNGRNGAKTGSGDITSARITRSQTPSAGIRSGKVTSWSDLGIDYSEEKNEHSLQEDRKEKLRRQKEESDIDREAKKILHRRNVIRNIVISAASLITAVSLIYFVIYYQDAAAAQAAYDELASLKGTDPVADEIEQKPLFTLAEGDVMPEILDEYKNIYIKNKSVVGWLSIDGTNIDYPVMQTTNNDYYLTHDFEGNEDKNGALFVDCACNIPFRSTNIIIYGHHMKSGKMFGNLKKYESEDYCKEHSVIKFDTIYEKGTYKVMYVFRDNIRDAEDVSFKYYQFIDATSEEEYNSNLASMAEMSFYDTGVTAEYGDDLLTLSTCSGTTSTERFVVVAKRIS